MLQLLRRRRHRQVFRIVGATHAAVLVLAHVVVGKEVDSPTPSPSPVGRGEATEKAGRMLDVLIVGINAVDEGDADAEVVAGLGHAAYVFKD